MNSVLLACFGALQRRYCRVWPDDAQRRFDELHAAAAAAALAISADDYHHHDGRVLFRRHVVQRMMTGIIAMVINGARISAASSHQKDRAARRPI